MCTSSSSTCSTTDLNAYSNCVIAACDSNYKTCLGPNYKTGSYSGVCATYIGCVNACACNDTTCTTACGLPDASCQTCLSQLTTCSATCTIPSCFLSGGGGTGGGLGGSAGTVVSGTCADLLACCNATSATLKSTCMQAYTSEMQLGGDLACGVALSTLKSTFCP